MFGLLDYGRGASEIETGKASPRPHGWPASLACFAAGLVLTSWLAASCATRPSPPLQRYEFSRPEMGVPFRMVLYAPDLVAAHRAADAAFDRIQSLNDRLTDYEYESELNRLSRTSGQGKFVPVSDDLWRILERSQQLAALSRGALDVTVGPLVKLWRRARMEHKLPDPVRLAQASNAVGYAKMELDALHRAVLLTVPNMRLDLGAIAKGYAAQEAIKTLRAQGIRRALVTAAGDMMAGDPPPGKPGWRIEIAPLDATNSPASQFVLLNNHGLATSGDQFQRLEIQGVRYSHILNPHTGLGLTDHSLVTVLAPDGMTADGLSTAVSVLGPAAGLKLIEQTRGAAASITRRPNQRIETFGSRRLPKFLDKP